MGNFRARALETNYDGYKFRSRLEARWAVYFNTLGIQFMYEPEGFILSDGNTYLPDFYLPEFKCCAEVKGGPAKTLDLHKTMKLVTDLKIPVLYLNKEPGYNFFEFAIPTDDGKYRTVDVNVMQDPNRKRGKFATGFYLTEKEEYEKYKFDKAIEAVKAARAHRFGT